VRGPRNTYVPSREELRRACQEIQRGWSLAERRKRLVTRLPGWLPPLIRVEELGFGSRIPND
jgi:hypothetical protein